MSAIVPQWQWLIHDCEHLKALVFLYAFEESVDCHLLSSFCDDSNLHISLLLCTFHDGCKQGIGQQIFNRNKSISRKITHPQSLLFK